MICAPIVEEYVFRKLIIDRTVQYGQATAILLSGLMFALFHGNFNQFVYAFTLGVFWGFIYVKTGRLIYTVALHMTVNFLGSIPGLLLMKSTFFNQLSLLAENNPSAIVGLVMQHPVQFLLICFYMLLLFGLVITGIIFWAINFKKFKCAPGEITIPKGKRFSTIILNVRNDSVLSVLVSDYFISCSLKQIYFQIKMQLYPHKRKLHFLISHYSCSINHSASSYQQIFIAVS